VSDPPAGQHARAATLPLAATPPGPPRVAVRTLGCKVNRSESDQLSEQLLASGIAVTDDESAADVIVINSCTVTGEADAKTRKAVRRALASPTAPTVIVTGCMAVVDADGLRALGSRVIVEGEKTLLAGRVSRTLEDASATDGALSGAPTRTRATVKVQDGCDHRCAYCIVPDARGPARSVAASDVVARVAALVARGTAEVVLTGVNIGRYSDVADHAGDHRDGPGAPDLAALIMQVAATGIARIRISSIEPLDLTPRLLEILAATPAVMPHLHVPLQSGCDETLHAMRRGYSTRDFARALARARAKLPGLAVTTDAIAGFPGESDAHFAETLAFVEGCAFTRPHVFRYSRRAGTPAATMPGQVPPRDTAARAAALRALGDRLDSAHAARRVGGEADVLVEKVEGRTAEGTSEDYLRTRVSLPAGVPVPCVGDILPVTLTSADRGCVRAEPSPARPRPRV
jgi:threonylcarbamoyladenosine tRNA methylthiotransferase MtaB